MEILHKYLINVTENADNYIRSIYENLLNTYGYNGMADSINTWYTAAIGNETNVNARKRLTLHRDAMLMLLAVNHLFAFELDLDHQTPDYLNTKKP